MEAAALLSYAYETVLIATKKRSLRLKNGPHGEERRKKKRERWRERERERRKERERDGSRLAAVARIKRVTVAILRIPAAAVWSVRRCRLRFAAHSASTNQGLRTPICVSAAAAQYVCLLW
jgi:hypothetical protein